MIRIFVKKAQGIDTLLGMPPPGAPMGGMPPGVAAPPMAAPPVANTMSKGNPTEKEKPPFYKPLDSLSDVLYDAEAEQLIEDSPNLNADELAMKIWKDYGGDENGNAYPDKTGKRIEKDQYNIAKADKERKMTDKSRWKRLPQGKVITDIFSLDELAKVMDSLILGHVKETKQQQAPGGAPGGMPPMPMASSLHKWLRLSHIADQIHPRLGDAFDDSLVRTINLSVVV